MKVSDIPVKYIRVVQDMYKNSITYIRSAAGLTDSFNVEVRLHQGSALGPLLFTAIMDRLIDDVRKEDPQNLMFADDIVQIQLAR